MVPSFDFPLLLIVTREDPQSEDLALQNALVGYGFDTRDKETINIHNV